MAEADFLLLLAKAFEQGRTAGRDHEARLAMFRQVGLPPPSAPSNPYAEASSEVRRG